MPGVQNPHWLPPVEHRASAHSLLAPAGSSPSTVVMVRPATRRSGRHTRATRGAAVDQHRAAAALPLGAAPVLGSVPTEVVAQRVEERTSRGRRTSHGLAVDHQFDEVWQVGPPPEGAELVTVS
jgi:hypothetical protein